MAEPPKKLPSFRLQDIIGKGMEQQQQTGTALTELLECAAWPQFPPLPPIIQDRWFKDDVVYIDGYIFEKCRFDRCKLITENATFTFRNCFISPDCRLFFKGPALKIVRLLMHTLRMQKRIQILRGEEGVYATPNSDGTFSLE